MNNDLISRSELKKAIQNLYDETPDGIVRFGIEKSYDVIDNAPTVEPKAIKVNIPEDVKDKLIEELSKPRKAVFDEPKTLTDCIIAYGDGYESARRLFERPHGKWEYNQYDGNAKIGNWHCSNCHNICYEMKLTYDNYNFCPNCGADMRKGEDND